MKNVVGHPATGKDFYQRKREIKKIKRSLSANNHLQIAAPRRVGKTSILMYFFENEQNEDYYFVYVDVEATESTNDFYRKLYTHILRSDALNNFGKLFKQLKNSSNSFLKRVKAVSLIDGAIEFNTGSELNYYEELALLIKGLDFENKKLILLIDEFPYAINNLIKEDNVENALKLLKSKRTMRQDPEINKKVQFVYTGSISLNLTVENINASELVNDISSIAINPLDKFEAIDFIQALVSEENIILSESQLEYIVQKVNWLIPFHIQLFVKELFDIMDEFDDLKVSNEIIDRAFEEIIDIRNNNYFEHYSSRLKKLYKGQQYDLAYSILTYVSINDSIDKSVIFNLSSKFDLEKNHKNVIQNLVYDGYLFQNEDSFQFNSPILKMWWKKNVS